MRGVGARGGPGDAGAGNRTTQSARRGGRCDALGGKPLAKAGEAGVPCNAGGAPDPRVAMFPGRDGADALPHRGEEVLRGGDLEGPTTLAMGMREAAAFAAS
jgi:hypothetical protein